MGIQSIVLEYHCDITILGLYIVNHPVANLQFTRRNIFQTSDHTKRCGLTASRRSYEDDEFLVCYLQIEILNRLKAVRIHLTDIL